MRHEPIRQKHCSVNRSAAGSVAQNVRKVGIAWRPVPAAFVDHQQLSRIDFACEGKTGYLAGSGVA